MRNILEGVTSLFIVTMSFCIFSSEETVSVAIISKTNLWAKIVGHNVSSGIIKSFADVPIVE
jgi:hypothetical protein